MSNEINVDNKTVEGFGDEWERFDQSSLTEKEQKKFLRAISRFSHGMFCLKMLKDLILGVEVVDGQRWLRRKWVDYIV